MRRRQRGAAAPYPVFAFGFRQYVDIEYDLPVGRRRAVVRERCTPPQALGILFVLPEIVDVPAALSDPGDAIARIQDVEQRGPIVLELGIAQCIPSLGVACL